MSIEISAVITGHKEGLLSGPSVASFTRAVEKARRAGLRTEMIAVLDRPDALTRSAFADLEAGDCHVRVTDGGDPALTRNAGVEAAQGRYVSFLDADDLWSENWLVAAHAFCRAATRSVIGHSECNFAFGREPVVWIHADSEDESFDVDYMRLANYWDAMSFAERAVFLDVPFVKNDVRAGYGHEDWFWNCETLLRGYAHRPVPGTIHLKRQRGGSQSALCSANDVVPWPNAIENYAWDLARRRLLTT